MDASVLIATGNGVQTSRERVLCGEHPDSWAPRDAAWLVTYRSIDLNGTPATARLYACDLCLSSALRWANAKHLGIDGPAVIDLRARAAVSA